VQIDSKEVNIIIHQSGRQTEVKTQGDIHGNRTKDSDFEQIKVNGIEEVLIIRNNCQ
jgi:hypothetical protein